MQTVFRGVNVVAKDVRREMRTFDAEYLDPNNYESWLESSNYKYAVEHKGRFYPPKHLLSSVTTIPTTNFSGGDGTNHVFEALGVSIRSLRNPNWMRDELVLALDLYFRRRSNRHS